MAQDYVFPHCSGMVPSALLGVQRALYCGFQSTKNGCYLQLMSPLSSHLKRNGHVVTSDYIRSCHNVSVHPFQPDFQPFFLATCFLLKLIVIYFLNKYTDRQGTCLLYIAGIEEPLRLNMECPLRFPPLSQFPL